MKQLRIYRVFVVLALCVTPPLEVHGQAFSFYFIEQQAPRTSFGTVSWVDLDYDGRLDLILTGNEGDLNVPAFVFEAQQLLENELIPGPARPTTRLLYSESTMSARGMWLGAVALADANGDGLLDMFSSGANGGQESWTPSAALFVQDRDLAYVQDASSFPGLFAGAAVWIDLDNDTQPELITTGIAEDGSLVSARYRHENGGWVSEPTDVPGLANAAFAPADVDGDGDVDLALSGRSATGRFLTKLFVNDGGMLRDSGEELVGVAYGSLDWADFDNDGDPDLLVSGGRVGPLVLEGTTRIYRNAGGSLSEAAISLKGVVGGAVRWGDYDNDGWPDIVWTGVSHVYARPTAGIYRNLRDGKFEHVITLPGALAGNAKWGDYDGDGDLDLTLQGMSADLVPMLLQYENDQRIVNQAPGTPEGLSASVSGDAVTLSWTAASDAETEEAGLTYNLRLGSEPGAIDVVHPFSRPATGARLMALPGNAGHRTSWTFEGLAPGSYFWSVQSIDAGYHGSTFASEISFSIGSGSGGNVTTNTEWPGDLPGSFAVGESFPNPFSIATTFQVRLPREAHVVLEVFDVLGGRVAVPFQGGLGPGTHLIKWNASSYAAGTYFYRVRTDADQAATGTVVRIR